jgi:hypothetical protein
MRLEVKGVAERPWRGESQRNSTGPADPMVTALK